MYNSDLNISTASSFSYIYLCFIWPSDGLQECAPASCAQNFNKDGNYLPLAIGNNAENYRFAGDNRVIS